MHRYSLIYQMLTITMKLEGLLLMRMQMTHELRDVQSEMQISCHAHRRQISIHEIARLYAVVVRHSSSYPLRDMVHRINQPSAAAVT